MDTPKQSEAELNEAAEAFITKLKSITIGTGKSATACDYCGKPLSGHFKIKGFGVVIQSRRRAQGSPEEERAFAA